MKIAKTGKYTIRKNKIYKKAMNKGKNATFLKAGEDNIHIEKVGRYPDPSLFKSKEIHKREKKITTAIVTFIKSSCTCR